MLLKNEDDVSLETKLRQLKMNTLESIPAGSLDGKNQSRVWHHRYGATARQPPYLFLETSSPPLTRYTLQGIMEALTLFRMFTKWWTWRELNPRVQNFYSLLYTCLIGFWILSGLFGSLAKSITSTSNFNLLGLRFLQIGYCRLFFSLSSTNSLARIRY